MNYIENISGIIEHAKKQKRALSEEENLMILNSLKMISKEEKNLAHEFEYDEQCLVNFESIVESICTLLRASVESDLLSEVSSKLKLLADEVEMLAK